MTPSIIPGRIQTIAVYDQHEHGYLLGDEAFTIFLPSRGLAPDQLEKESYEVFVFYNENGELEATTKLPIVQVNEVDVFRVKNVNTMGAFIDIGSVRDILLPNKEMKEPLETGFTILAGLLDDPLSGRLYMTQKINGFFPNADIPFERGDEVELLIGEKLEVGRRALVNQKYMAALFRAEMTFPVKLGDRVKGYIRKIEGKSILVSMQREGMLLLEDAQKKLLGYLEANNGYVRLNDDTDPDEVKQRLHMSKKTFKKAAGMLYRDGKVILTKLGIKINTTGELPSAEELAKWAPKEERLEGKPMPKPSGPYRGAELRGEQPARRNYDSNERSPRPSYGNNDRPSRPSYGNNDRPSYGNNDRPSRPSYGNNDRPSYGNNDRSSRPSYGNNDRPSYGNNDRPSRPSYGNNERPSYGNNDRSSRPNYGDSDSTRGPRRDERSAPPTAREYRPNNEEQPFSDREKKSLRELKAPTSKKPNQE